MDDRSGNERSIPRRVIGLIAKAYCAPAQVINGQICIPCFQEGATLVAGWGLGSRVNIVVCALGCKGSSFSVLEISCFMRLLFRNI